MIFHERTLDVRWAEQAIIILYPVSESGIIILSKTPRNMDKSSQLTL